MKTTHTQIICFSKIPKTQTKRRFLALIKHYIYQPRVLELPILLSQFLTRASTNHNCILPLFTCRPFQNFVFAIRSGTYKLLQRISFMLFSIFIDKDDSPNNLKTTVCLSCFKQLQNCLEHKASKTRQHDDRVS